MNKLGLNKKECVEALQSYDKQIEKIIDLFNNSSHVSQENVQTARELLKSLKESLKSDFKKRDTRKGEEMMSGFEKSIFFPAVHEAMTRIYVTTNSIPNQKWLDDLFDVQLTFHYYLSQSKNTND